MTVLTQSVLTSALTLASECHTGYGLEVFPEKTLTCPEHPASNFCPIMLSVLVKTIRLCRKNKIKRNSLTQLKLTMSDLITQSHGKPQRGQTD